MDRLQEHEFVYGGKSHNTDLRKDLPIFQDDLSDEFANQSVLYAYYAILAAKAEAAFKECKMKLVNAESRADAQVRQQLEENGVKITEARVRSGIMQDGVVMQVRETLMLAEKDSLIMRAIEAAFKMRADMLIRLGAMQRSEMSQINTNIKEPTTRENIKSKMDGLREQNEELV